MTTKTTTALVNGHEAVPGCYVSGDWGWRAHLRCVLVAQDYGFAVDNDLVNVLVRFATGETTDDVIDPVIGAGGLTDQAEVWLNDHTTDGFIWHWSDGEFFLSLWCGEDPDCTDDECACSWP